MMITLIIQKNRQKSSNYKKRLIRGSTNSTNLLRKRFKLLRGLTMGFEMEIDDVLFFTKGKEAKIIYNDSIELCISNFEIKYFISGKLYLYFDIKKQNFSQIDKVQKIVFKGETEQGLFFNQDITKEFNETPIQFKFFGSGSTRIQLRESLLLEKENKGNKTILKSYLTNFLFDYNDMTHNGFLINIKEKEFTFRNTSNYKESKEFIKNRFITKITGYYDIELQDDYPEVKQIIRNILELISYSQRQFIQVPYEEIINENKEVFRIYLYPQVLRQPRSGFNVVEANIGYENDQRIMKLIEDCYDNYSEWKEKIKLDYSLTYYLLAFISFQAEVQYMLVFTAIESLVRHYEDYFIKQKGYDLKKIKQEQAKNDISRKLENLDENNEKICDIIKDRDQKIINIVADPKNRFFYPNLDFQQSLDILYEGKIKDEYKDESFGFKLKKDDFDRKVNEIRNNLMHKGEFHDYDDSNKISKDLDCIVFMFDKIFLMMLGYKGYFRDYRDIEKWIKLEDLTKKQLPKGTQKLNGAS